MRSCSAIALFTLAVLTECLAASDRSRQRSGPIRSVPVAADIKRDVDFDCPEEFGYYPHPTDCTLYYVCVFGGALLESCTGGLMYSHELQTCDWPRNVGCDGTSAVGGEELERYSERDSPPPPPPPRRTPAPPPPRAQPKPIITSRGQPKFSRAEYEKQQQLYAEIDDLPPVEEIESDRQQRVYRGQPSTIGQVQKDRDGYVAQTISSGRNYNSNIIPASIPDRQSSKIGSFSFGSQVDDRRTATITPAPQSYNDDNDDVTDSHHDRLSDIDTNTIDVTDSTQKHVLRKKREVTTDSLGTNLTLTEPLNSTSKSENITKRSDSGEEMEYFEVDPDYDNSSDGDVILDDGERGKRQIRYYSKNPYKAPSKHWALAKPVRIQDQQSRPSYSQNVQSQRYPSNYNNNYNEPGRQYFTYDNRYPIAYQNNPQTERPFKPSLLDQTHQKQVHSPVNPATNLITKSPPISSLSYTNNPFTSLAGGFYNNSPRPNHEQIQSHFITSLHHINDGLHHDLSILPSTVVTGKPIPVPTSGRPHSTLRPASNKLQNQETGNDNSNNQSEEEEYEDEGSDESEESSSEENDEGSKHYFPEPPYEFTHPSHKYANIENPFASPNFDFDEFLSKISNGQYTPAPKAIPRIVNSAVGSSTPASIGSALRSSTLNYQGMSTPKPFTADNGFTAQYNDKNIRPQAIVQQPQLYDQFQSPKPSLQAYTQQQQAYTDNSYNKVQQTAGLPLDAIRPKLKPPNFKDDRQLPITYSFTTPNSIENKFKGDTQQIVAVTPKPYVFVSTNRPILSTPIQQYAKPEKYTQHQNLYVVTTKPFEAYIQSTQKPLTTIANQQLSALQDYWKQNPTANPFSVQSVTLRPSTGPNIAKLESLFAEAIKSSTKSPAKQNPFLTLGKDHLVTTAKPGLKRRPIPKPSPEMNDYYYDEDDEQFYYEPVVKPKYMPSTEIKPQRPLVAQNYKEYDDSYEDSREQTSNVRPLQKIPQRPMKYNTAKPETATKNHNDLSAPTKSLGKNEDNKIPIPVLVDYTSPTSSVLIRPEVSNYEVVHHSPRNRTIHLKKPMANELGPNTSTPPKYLNQTTLRPYTVRHRLAKPTTVPETTKKTEKQTRNRIRHPNIVAQKLTTPRDSYNQETRVTKINHDGRTNSLEPTENVTPVSYSPSPRPKMLYNGSQAYNPDQYDPYYAVYDEDGELYKDADYVQQYNIASVRPAVQQTYRGTPPPARRPVETYTARPVSADDYDDALIQGQISNQNQYQSPVRQSTRGEGNELGYEHNPSSVRTTLYEATSISTTPSTTTSTTTTTTTTQRPTTAPYTEAMTPSRYTSRSSTDENPSPKPDTSTSSIIDPTTSTTPSHLNLSFLAKPFEVTDNLHRLGQTLPTTEKMLTARRSSHLTNSNTPVEVVQDASIKSKKKILSLTTGFSIRRNENNSNNPYTLTVLTRPIDDYNKPRKLRKNNTSTEPSSQRYYYDISDSRSEETTKSNERGHHSFDRSTESVIRRTDAIREITEEYDIPIRSKPLSRSRFSAIPTSTTTITSTTTTSTSTTVPTSTTTKYYLKTVLKRPTATSTEESTDDSISSRNSRINVPDRTDTQTEDIRPVESDTYIRSDITQTQTEPVISPYRTLDNLRNSYRADEEIPESFTKRTVPSTTTKKVRRKFEPPTNIKEEQVSRVSPSYYSYRLEDEEVPNQTTEVFSGKVKHVIQAFLNNEDSSPIPQIVQELPVVEYQSSTTPITEERIVNIGFQRKNVRYTTEKPLRNNVKRLQIVTESHLELDDDQNLNNIHKPSENYHTINQDYQVTTTPDSVSTTSVVHTTSTAAPERKEQYEQLYVPSRDYFTSKFSSFVKTTEAPTRFVSVAEKSQKFESMIKTENPTVASPQPIDHELDESNENINDDKIFDDSNPVIDDEPLNDSERFSDIASTTSTTKATTTMKTEPTSTTTKMTTKSISFPTRASRVNPAIKLAATNLGGGRRSYQSSSKCSSDNSLQANPKCNEIKYQRPTSTRGRGSAHYSTSGGSDAPLPPPNRGTPPTRSRPTLKPSTAIVSKTTEFVDIYAHPPTRPAPVYPQPTPDKTAAKCRKDVCLLPDCYCGGKDIPGELPVESVPQIVLLTFDDSVNDLNKGLYTDLFEKGRVNPNGCPISATFYVSHEWTDYSQVQNLYSAGHEMASHTISHSFGEQFSQKKWNREVSGQREILAAYGGVKLEDVRGMRAPFLSVGGNKMFKMLYDSNFTYDSSLPVYENRPPSWPYTLDYKLFHDCMIPPCPTKSYPGVWEVPMVMWQDLNGGRCSMGDACANPPEPENVFKMILKNFDRHYSTNRAPFGLFYHAAWFTQPHHKEGFIMFLDHINQMQDVWIVTNWQALQWVRDPTPISRINNFQPFQCNYQDRPKKCNNPKVCNLWHKSGVRYMRTCQPCPEIYPWTGKSGIRSSRIDNDIGE